MKTGGRVKEPVLSPDDEGLSILDEACVTGLVVKYDSDNNVAPNISVANVILLDPTQSQSCLTNLSSGKEANTIEETPLLQHLQLIHQHGVKKRKVLLILWT
ncbi:hypothetical protein RN001_003659 [Aquatica leii]|uniref:Uncharacterized protein n=1 Tax=Aquatica leii TaxID=1421715 RepID=A0AAN7QP83_9COLE|nr:hypothetical protein RN001_003659 [Aquatica leii]